LEPVSHSQGKTEAKIEKWKKKHVSPYYDTREEEKRLEN
jgi:hypothetical protein